MNKENDSKEYGEDASKYGEFILSYFAWLSPEEQKQKTEKLQKITKNNETVDFNGKLLKLANIPISDISYNLNFKIHLKNSLEQSFVYNVDLNMPLKDKNSSIYYCTYCQFIQ